ncbi:hypothetical protein MKW94_015428 [Papaver nudicaule]|uniref:Lysosomal Pro-X carboxypeptidase n=1 Tax=Papaver nudicaule TaxID=74823 RepID=A0AA41VK98_PAPNU|nr:hypothetical protein [Papaver nudicaule]
MAREVEKLRAEESCWSTVHQMLLLPGIRRMKLLDKMPVKMVTVFPGFLQFISICVAGGTPRLSAIGRTHTEYIRVSSYLATTSSGYYYYEEFFYTQTLDHFNYRPESYETFQQKYLINFKNWGGADDGAPIFVYLGGESEIDEDPGFLCDNAPQFKALIVSIEHRYYGKSVPFGSRKEAFRNASTLGYLNSAQALADYAEVIISLKKNLSADSSPVIVFGGSYGGMLASWFRLKYPHIVHGALASSAPVLYFDNNFAPKSGYWSIVSKDYLETSKFCYDVITQSWSVIDSIASKENGLAILSQKFKTCSPLNKSSELKDYLQYSIYAESAQYNAPPEYPVTVICNAIVGAPKGSDILSRIQSGVAAFSKQMCYEMGESTRLSETEEGWLWQVCSEMVMPIGDGEGWDTMFPASPFDLKNLSSFCQSWYNVTPRPHWILNEYGGKGIKSVLQTFASNIIYSNGLRDPFSGGGVLENISDTVVAITTDNGSHCLDLLHELKDDPKWLVKQREAEIEIIKRWIEEYNALPLRNGTTKLSKAHDWARHHGRLNGIFFLPTVFLHVF